MGLTRGGPKRLQPRRKTARKSKISQLFLGNVQCLRSCVLPEGVGYEGVAEQNKMGFPEDKAE
jgi:hypothetical protein